MATMVATEEFPLKGHVSPKAAAPAVIKSNKLEGGVQSISRDTTSAFVSFKFAVVGGSGAESKSTKGAAHFLSKAAFAGSKSISGMKLVNDLEGLGASFQSYADKEKIVYDVAVLADKADQAVGAVLTAIASPPHANYVLEELKAAAELDYVRHAADTSAQLRELVQEAAFGEDSPLGAPRLASKAKKLSVDQVLEYRTARFVRSNLVVAANGISQANLDATLSKHAGVVPAGSAPAVSPSPYKGGEVKVRTDLDGTSRLGLAFPVPAGEDGKAYAVLSALVAQALGEQKLCCTPYVQTFRHGGLMGVEAANAQHLEAYINALKAIANKCPDIEAAKQKLTLEHFLALEGHCSSSVLLNAHLRGLSPEAAGDVRGVTAASVSAAAAAALKATPAYAVLGATAGTPSFSAVTKMF